MSDYECTCDPYSCCVPGCPMCDYTEEVDSLSEQVQRLTAERHDQQNRADYAVMVLQRMNSRTVQLEDALGGMLDLYGREEAQTSGVFAVQQAIAAVSGGIARGRGGR